MLLNYHPSPTFIYVICLQWSDIVADSISLTTYKVVLLSIGNKLRNGYNTTLKGAVAYGNYFFPKKFEFVSLCSFICLQAVYQLSGPVCKATWNGCPSYSASYFHFTLCD